MTLNTIALQEHLRTLELRQLCRTMADEPPGRVIRCGGCHASRFLAPNDSARSFLPPADEFREIHKGCR